MSNTLLPHAGLVQQPANLDVTLQKSGLLQGYTASWTLSPHRDPIQNVMACFLVAQLCEGIKVSNIDNNNKYTFQQMLGDSSTNLASPSWLGLGVKIGMGDVQTLKFRHHNVIPALSKMTDLP